MAVSRMRLLVVAVVSWPQVSLTGLEVLSLEENRAIHLTAFWSHSRLIHEAHRREQVCRQTVCVTPSRLFLLMFRLWLD